MSTLARKALPMVLLCSFAAHAQQWVFQGGKQTNNGSVTVKSVDGSSSQAATQNPTGAAAKVNQTAVTQPPVVVMQATAKLPVVVEGAACNSTTDQLGVKADLSMTYACRSNVWAKTIPENCPDGQVWTGGACKAISSYAGTGWPANFGNLTYSLPGGVTQCPSGYVMTGVSAGMGAEEGTVYTARCSRP